MTRYAAGLAAVLLSSVVAAGGASARDHDGGGRPHPRFVHPHRHAHPFVFRSFVFFGAPVFARVPVALYPAQPYPAYVVAPIPGWPNCYQYQTTAIVGGLAQPAFGTACLGPDGLWHIY